MGLMAILQVNLAWL